MNRRTVVPVRSTVTEDQFQTCVIEGLARAQAAFGNQKSLAFVMDLSTKQVGNVMAGAATDAKRLWDVHACEGSALSDVADLYGLRLVPKDAVCTSDEKPLSVTTCALLKKAIDAELDGIETHQELLGMESELRDMRALIDRRLARIADLRAPRGVAA
jgi:hypothetical protein